VSTTITHNELVRRGCEWLRSKGCKIVLSEFHAVSHYGEVPDVIGWRGGVSILVEAKTSRSDLFADRKKPFRVLPEAGMGDWRFIIAPPGVCAPSDLPSGWGLLVARPNRIEQAAGVPRGSCLWANSAPFKGNRDAEQRMLLSALRRLQLHHGDTQFDSLIHRPFAEKARAAGRGNSQSVAEAA
jgi:hypothetical protein